MLCARFFGIVLAAAIPLGANSKAETPTTAFPAPDGTMTRAVKAIIPASLAEEEPLDPPEGPFVPEELGEIEIKPKTLGDEFAPSEQALAGAYGAAAGPQAAAPSMIGDLFGGGGGGSRVLIDSLYINTGFQEDFYVSAIPPADQPVVIARSTAPFSIEGVAFPTTSTMYTTINRAAVDSLLSVDPIAAMIPVAEPGYLSAVDQVFVNRHGSGGATEYAASRSYAYIADSNRIPGPLAIADEFGAVWYYDYYIHTINVPNPAAGGVVGRMKIADNTSPMPRDRLLFNYSYFDNVPLATGGVGVSRFTPGFEKTFYGGQASFEMKIPMAVTLDSILVEDGSTDLSHGELGNMGLTFKALVLQRRNWACSVGMTISVPTADDTRLVATDGTQLIHIQNEAVHLAPFVGLLWTPNDCFFAQGFVQWEVEANPNPVFINQGNGLAYVDDIHDTTYQYVDVGIGQWLYQSNSPCQRLSGVAWTAELHWNYSLKATDFVEAGNYRAGDLSSVQELFNLTLGLHVEFYERTSLTLGYTTPLGGGRDQQFDGEFRLLVNRRFGPQSRITRTPTMY